MTHNTAGTLAYLESTDSPDETSFIPALFSDGTAVYARLPLRDSSLLRGRYPYRQIFVTHVHSEPSALELGALKKRVEIVESVRKKMKDYNFQKGTSSTIEYEGADSILTNLEQIGYSLTKLSTLRATLVKYPFLLPLLIEAKDALAGFYPTAECRLEPMMLSDETSGITLFVELKGNVDASYDLLEKFDDTWWLSNLDRAKGRISIILDFV